MRIEQRQALELFDIERAKAGKEYPAGTVLIQLSACGTKGDVWRLREAGQIETKFAALVPKNAKDASYLYFATLGAYPEFAARHVTTINLQFEELERFTIPYHTDANQRKEFAATLESVERLERAEEQAIAALMEEKSYFLQKMFV